MKREAIFLFESGETEKADNLLKECGHKTQEELSKLKQKKMTEKPVVYELYEAGDIFLCTCPTLESAKQEALKRAKKYQCEVVIYKRTNGSSVCESMGCVDLHYFGGES